MLAVIGDRAYAGYGDYVANTGPIHIESVALSDPTGDWTDHATAPTEQLSVFRGLTDGRIVVPWTDPRDPAVGGFTVGDSGVWVDVNAPDTTHMIGMAQVGSRLFAAGLAEDSRPTVWVSEDDGDTWAVSLSADSEDPFSFYFLAVVGSSVYVKAGNDTTYKWTEATGWDIVGIDLLPFGQRGAPGAIWRDGYLIPDRFRVGAGPMLLYYFDGATSTLIEVSSPIGFTVDPDDGSLLVESSNRLLYRIAAAGPMTPVLVGRVERLGTEIDCALAKPPGDTLLVGTSQSRIKEVALA